MSVRPHEWFTSKQIRSYAQRIGEPDLKAARRTLSTLLRKRREDDPEAIATLKELPERPRSGYLVDYVDQKGVRCAKLFRLKKAADAHHATVKVEVMAGTHVNPSKSVTVAEAGEAWADFVEAEGRERTTVDSYREHLKLHINPRIGYVKLADLNKVAVENFRDKLVKELSSRAMAKKVLGSLKMLLRDARRRGHAVVNPAEDTKVPLDKRAKRQLEAGEDFPEVKEIRLIIAAAPEGKARALLMVAAFTGLRASELRGLRWSDVNFAKGVINVRQRADRRGKIGRPKSAAGSRTVDIGPDITNALRRLKLKTNHELVFATTSGKPDLHTNIRRRIWHRAQLGAGIVEPVLDKTTGKPVVNEEGEPVVKARYQGFHSLRHFAASYMLHPTDHDGRGFDLREAQRQLGHATLAMTSDLYGHFLPRKRDAEAIARTEKHLFAVVS